MKAVIPVAGVGTRLRPLTHTQPKPLIPVGGKPILAFIIERLMKAGINEFVFIIGYLGESIHDFVRERYPEIISYFVQQNERRGIGHAIWLARDVIRDEPVFIVLGDTVFEAEIEPVVQSDESYLAIKMVDDPREFGVAEVAENGSIIRVIEKPKIPKSNLALVGIYKINNTAKLIQTLEENIKNKYMTLGEIQLTDAIGKMIKDGEQFRSFKVENWYDCGKKDSLLQTNALLLKKFGGTTSDHPGLKNTILIEPVSINKGCKVSNSIIGPNVTIGENSHIDYSIIRDSIIGNFSKLESVVLHHSVVGSDASVKGLNQSLNLGDHTEIDLG